MGTEVVTWSPSKSDLNKYAIHILIYFLLYPMSSFEHDLRYIDLEVFKQIKRVLKKKKLFKIFFLPEVVTWNPSKTDLSKYAIHISIYILLYSKSSFEGDLRYKDLEVFKQIKRVLNQKTFYLKLKLWDWSCYLKPFEVGLE